MEFKSSSHDIEVESLDHPTQNIDGNEHLQMETEDILSSSYKNEEFTIAWLFENGEQESAVESKSVDEEKQNNSNTEFNPIGKKVSSSSSENEGKERITESDSPLEVKPFDRDSEFDPMQMENVASSCGSCNSKETEFVEMKTNKKFFDWIGSGLIKVFHRICCCCCRK